MTIIKHCVLASCQSWLFALMISAHTGRAATVYTNETDFVNALGSSQRLLNDFANLTERVSYAHLLRYSSNGLAYNFTSDPSLYIGSLPGAVSTTDTNVIIITRFTSTNVNAVGGWFFLTDTSGAAMDGSVTVTLNGSTTATVPSSTSGPLFWGCVSDTLLTNLTIQSDSGGGYPTLEHFYASEVQPVITLSVVSRSALVVSWPAPTAGYVLQTSTNRSSGGWTGIGIPPVMSNGQMQVTVPMSGPATFYRLVKP